MVPSLQQSMGEEGASQLTSNREQPAKMYRFKPRSAKVKLGVKLAGVHWCSKSLGHAAELTAGYHHTAHHNGYKPIMQMLAKHNAQVRPLALLCSDTVFVRAHTYTDTSVPVVYVELLWHVVRLSASIWCSDMRSLLLCHSSDYGCSWFPTLYYLGSCPFFPFQVFLLSRTASSMPLFTPCVFAYIERRIAVNNRRE
jgi:hypothetical protein